MYSQALLVVVAIGLCSYVTGFEISGELSEVIEQLQHDVGELKQDCHKEQVHVHIHGDASKEPPHDDTNAVNVNLNLHLDDKPHHDEETQYAHCVMDSHGVKGHLYFSQDPGKDHAKIVVSLFGFPDHEVEHHLDIHERGIIADGCDKLGPEFDPYHIGHGAIGVVSTDADGHMNHTFTHTVYSIHGWESVIGRSVVVDDKDHHPLACCSIVRVSAAEVAHEMEEEHHEEEHLAHYHEEHHDPHADVHYAHCEMSSHGQTPEIHGHVYFEEHGDEDHVKIEVELFGFADHETDHHFAIHEYAHVEEGCSEDSLGSEYDPEHHGHGDIGTAATDADGHINHTFTHTTFTMKGDHDIIGRSVVVDDPTHRWLACCNILHATKEEIVAEKEAEHHEEEALAHYEGKHTETAYAHCLMKHHDDASGLDTHGTILITQHDGDEHAKIDVEMFDFPDHDKDHHFSVHTSGNLKDGCGNVGVEFDPFHVGNGLIGTAATDADGHLHHSFPNSQYTLEGLHSIIGRSIVVDDDHGTPYACCAVGWSSAKEHDTEALESLHEAQTLAHHEEHHEETHQEAPVVHPELHTVAEDTVYGHCNFSTHGHGDSNVHGHLHLIQHEGEDHAKMEVDLFAIPDVNTEHHLLVHTKGEIGDGCANTGPIFDPEEEHHGSIGTVTTDADGHVQHSFDHTTFTMAGFHSIIGRSVVLDDKLGDPLACCVVTWSTKEQYEEELAHDHHEAETLPHHQEGARRKRSAVHPKLAVNFL